VIEACVDSQTFGDGQHDLPMSDRRAHFFGNVERGQQGPLLVERGAGATLFAGERDEHLECVLVSRTFLLLVFFSSELLPSKNDDRMIMNVLWNC
jgi:hypothetical protein